MERSLAKQWALDEIADNCGGEVVKAFNGFDGVVKFTDQFCPNAMTVPFHFVKLVRIDRRCSRSRLSDAIRCAKAKSFLIDKSAFACMKDAGKRSTFQLTVKLSVARCKDGKSWLQFDCSLPELHNQIVGVYDCLSVSKQQEIMFKTAQSDIIRSVSKTGVLDDAAAASLAKFQSLIDITAVSNSLHSVSSEDLRCFLHDIALCQELVISMADRVASDVIETLGVMELRTVTSSYNAIDISRFAYCQNAAIVGRSEFAIEKIGRRTHIVFGGAHMKFAHITSVDAKHEADR